ncbi:ankyrin repeats (3 copies) domain-containing protein [Trichoderma breve]|uniref:Ankyrin repeats (3 copies) domain-containing protein n=1 Tax=Trichoderma breve TaxID=2034170 RepID=A0A9W9B610_9HYPO|nr:ankyrin repeats (3 copies) domain-containing protein [Trichoderma breve]KAJ4856607.1 ankyrin repeats (3 copies) domain-containing protein [Trichoderma breve]
MPNTHTPPSSRYEFKIAVLCALPLEASILQGLFDAQWDAEKYGKDPADTNAYSLGVLGPHNVVLVHMPNIGKVAAAVAAANLHTSFRGIQLALVVGICGGAPFGPAGELILGDVVISEGLVQYDLGRRLPYTFVRKDTPVENLPRPRPEVRAALAKLQTGQGRDQLQNKMLGHLRLLRQRSDLAIPYPGPEKDQLFSPNHLHMHQPPSPCVICTNNRDYLCSSATRASCDELGCSELDPRPRSRLLHSSNESQPVVNFGLVATGDTVMRSGEDRDRISARDEVIAFEMEGAGVWETFPAALVIKGVCDYADSHKNKTWQAYAAATAAAAAKAFLEYWHIGECYTSNPITTIHRSAVAISLPTSLPQHSQDNSEYRKTRQFGTRELEIMKKLNTSPYRDRKDRNPDRVVGTCEWFIQHQLFQDWRDSPASRLLWVSADPGCGKSVLVKYLVDSIVLTTPKTTVCYFFFKDDFEDQKSITSALCCIIYQLFQQNPALFTEAIVNQVEAGGERFLSSFSDLWHILLLAAEDVHAGEIICILDAIDECDDHGRSQLAKALCKLYGPDSRLNLKLKFLVTSRPFGNIRQGFQPLQVSGMPIIHLSGESEEEMKKIAAEIDIYIRARLMRVPNRTYLWVHLTLDLIENDINIDKAGILRATTHIPKTVDEAYNRILSKTAERALSLEELGFALSIQRHHRSCNDIDIKHEDRLRENIRDTCGLFVTVIQSRVYLLHQTAREFLVRDTQLLSTDYINPDLEWKHIILPHKSHKTLAKICISCLLLSDRGAKHVVRYHQSESTNGCILFNYSANYWTKHLRESHTKISEHMEQSIWKLCNVNSRLCERWLSVFWKKTSSTAFPEQFTTLMVVSYFGLDAMVKIILSTIADDDELNARDGTYGRSALSWAAGNGFDDVVKLLARGGRSWRRKLSLLLFGNLSEIDSMDASDNIGGTPLFYAMTYRREAIAKLLLEHGATPISEDKMATKLFFSAVEKDDVRVVQLFLESGFDIELRDRNNQTPLLSAFKLKHRDTFQVLLDRGANIDIRDGKGLTPLHYAAQSGDMDLVQLLLDKGASIDLVDNKKRTPLHYAIKSEDIHFIQFFLDNGANIDSVDINSHTPLHYAVKSRVINRGINRNNNRGINRGISLGVKLDIDRVNVPLYTGAVIESPGLNKRTPLDHATEPKNIVIVRLLLNYNANINSVDLSKRTPLSYAIESRDIKLIQLLVERGADAKLLHEEEQALIYVHQRRLLYVDIENAARPRVWGKPPRNEGYHQSNHSL